MSTVTSCAWTTETLSTMAMRALARSTEDSRRALVRSPSDDGVVLARVVL